MEEFLARNSSFIVDQFYGQLRSHITCNECGFETVKFDPFLALAFDPKDLNIKSRILASFDGCPDTLKLENLSIENNDNIVTVKALLEEVRKQFVAMIFPLDFTRLNLQNLSCMHLYTMDANSK